MKRTMGVMFLVCAAFFSGTAQADCKDEVKDLREEINEDRDKYTNEARAEAKKELAAAQVQIASPLECREHLRKARQALRKGKK